MKILALLLVLLVLLVAPLWAQLTIEQRAKIFERMEQEKSQALMESSQRAAQAEEIRRQTELFNDFADKMNAYAEELRDKNSTNRKKAKEALKAFYKLENSGFFGTK